MESPQSVAPAGAAVASLPDPSSAFSHQHSIATRSRTSSSRSARARGSRTSPVELVSPTRTQATMSISLAGTPPVPPSSDTLAPRRFTRAFLRAGHEAAAAAASSETDRSRLTRRTQPARKRKVSQMSPPPNAKDPPKLKSAPGVAKKPESEDESDGDGNCCICMCESEPAEKAGINGCHHIFCFACIEKWADRENKCPLCKARFSKIDRVNKPARRKGTKGPKNTKRVKDRDQRADLGPGQALQGLFASLEDGHGGLPRSIARLMLGIPSGRASARFTESPFAPPPPHAAAARHTRSIVAGRFDGPPSDDEDEGSFESFVHRVRALNRQANNLDDRIDSIGRGVFSAGIPVALLPPPSRSYASNDNDVDAGESAENALEICSDSDDDDEVEVVRVVAHAASL